MRFEHFRLTANDWVPNNAVLEVIVYRAVEQGEAEAVARAFEARFEENGWPPQWCDTIYDYHHYHSTAHEALGIAAGEAMLELGGPDRREVPVRAGDALILPVGTGHRLIRQSDDFLVVGAYPAGQDWDICREAPDVEARRRMAAVPEPKSDPIEGESGPLVALWGA